MTTTGTRPAAVDEAFLLRVRNVDVGFGGVKALTSVAMDVRAGEIHGVIGPNGAGKSTFMDVISGFLRPSGGTVELGGVRVDKWVPHRRARAGLGRTFQGLELFDDLSVRDNLSAGLVDGHRPSRAQVEAAAALLGVSVNSIGWSSNCRTGGGGWYRWPEPWPVAPVCCCWTNRPPGWRRARRRRWARC
jgi:ABC-type transporter Mla maintaining outer membrane lipid asymmetry ATPase subunit MlaF